MRRRALAAVCAAVMTASSCAGGTVPDIDEDEPFDLSQSVVTIVEKSDPKKFAWVSYVILDDEYAFGEEFDLIAVGSVANVREYSCVMKWLGSLMKRNGTFFDLKVSRVISSKNGDAPSPGETISVATAGSTSLFCAGEPELRNGMEILLFAARTDTDYMRVTEHFRFEEYADYWATSSRLIAERVGDSYIVCEYLADLVQGSESFASFMGYEPAFVERTFDCLDADPDLTVKEALLRQLPAGEKRMMLRSGLTSYWVAATFYTASGRGRRSSHRCVLLPTLMHLKQF